MKGKINLVNWYPHEEYIKVFIENNPSIPVPHHMNKLEAIKEKRNFYELATD